MICTISLFNVGNMYLEIGDFQNGINFVEKVVNEEEISEHIIIKGLNSFFSHKGIKDAIGEYSSNKIKNCIIKLKEIYKSEENNIVVNFLLGNSYFLIKKIEKAKCFYDKVLM